jgi:hypothetical protein
MAVEPSDTSQDRGTCPRSSLSSRDPPLRYRWEGVAVGVATSDGAMPATMPELPDELNADQVRMAEFDPADVRRRVDSVG